MTLNFQDPMKKIFLAILAISLSLSCSKKSEAVRTCYECTQLTVKKKDKIEYSFDVHTNTRCDMDQNKIDTETKDKNYVQEKNGVTTTSTFDCKKKDQ